MKHMQSALHNVDHPYAQTAHNAYQHQQRPAASYLDQTGTISQQWPGTDTTNGMEQLEQPGM